MQNHITHPITGILASTYSALSAYFDYFEMAIGFISALIGLVIGILSLINTWRTFKQTNKKND